MSQALSIRVALIAILLYSLFVLFNPQPARAVGFASDMQCIPAITQCGCGLVMGPHGCIAGNNKFMCPCQDSTNGFTTTGFCQADQKCHATNAPGMGGGNALDQGLQQLGQVLGQLMQKLMSGQQGGQQGGGGGGGTNPGCTPQQTSDMTVYQSNPQCFYYVAPTSAQLNPSLNTINGAGSSVSDLLLNSMGSNANGSVNTAGNGNANSSTNTNTNISDLLNQGAGNASTSNTSTTVTVAATTSNASSSTSQPFANFANLLPGIRGDIQVLGNGATVLGGQRDTNSNTEVAGFIGANTFAGNQPGGVVAWLCQTRPWAGGLFSKVIPPSFFDGLCSARGYQVGAPVPVKQTPQVSVSQTTYAHPATTTKSKAATTTVANVPPKVDIWAVPAKVSLGARTSIFWNTQGVTQCTETSPDGSFSQSSLSGGASTVPITAATTFTISCLAPDGSHVTNYVTVNLAL